MVFLVILLLIGVAIGCYFLFKKKKEEPLPKEETQPQKPEIKEDLTEKPPVDEPHKEEPPDISKYLDAFDIIVGEKTKNYLVELYKEAHSQFFKGYTNHGLPPIHQKRNYTIQWDYFGEDGDEQKAFDTLIGWLFAMQLTELVPHKKEQFYKIGYELGGYNKDSNIYGYKFQFDPNILRLSASIIYAAMRGYIKPDIEAMKKELDCTYKLATLADIREEDSFKVGDNHVYVDLRYFMPTAPGPYAPGYTERNGGYPFPNEKKTEDKNLYIDKSFHEYIVNSFDLEGDNQAYINRTVQAIADKDSNPNHLFGEDRIVNNNYFKSVFTDEVLGKEICLSEDLCKFVEDVMYISSYQRCILQGNKKQMGSDYQYGRLRPGCSWEKEAKRNSYTNDKRNVLVNFDIEEHDGHPTGYYNADGEWDKTRSIKSPEEYNDKMKDELWANSYPSGHSAGIWGVVLLLVELFPLRADLIMKAGNNYALSRMIARYHWLSDTLMGRVLATTINPVIHNCIDYTMKLSDCFN